MNARKLINGCVGSYAIELSNLGNTNELSFLYQFLQFPITENLNIEESWVRLEVSSSRGKFQPRKRLSLKEVPDVLHMKLRDALFLLERNSLKVTVEGNMHGVISRQSNVIANEITILLR